MRFSDAKITSRKRTPEGFLEVDAAVTRAGILQYHSTELGLDGDQIVNVRRTMQTVKHPETLTSIRRATVTVDHPDENVDITNWRELSVGEVVGEPAVDATGLVTAKIVIKDESAIELIEGGIDELSVGYTHSVVERSGEWVTDGPLVVNHVAIVEKGRAGPRVRIKDRRFPMEPKDIQAAVAQGVRDALAQVPNAALNGNDAAVANAITAALSPVVKTLEDMGKESKRKMDMEEEENRKKDAEKAADQLVAQTIADRDAYWTGVQACMPFLDTAAAAALNGKPMKDWLVAAVGDRVPNAAAYDESTLRGILMGMQAAGQGATPGVDNSNVVPLPSNAGAAPGALPAGVGQARDATPPGGGIPGVTHVAAPKLNTAQDRESAYDNYVKRLMNGGKAVEAGGA